jgi:hypothetical protein
MGRNGHIAQIERVTFAAERDRTGAAELRPALRGFPLQRPTERVVVPGVVVGEHQTPNLTAMRKRQRVGKA